MALKVLATGDIHIGKKSSGVHQKDDEIATKHTWHKIVEYAVKNEIDVLALTGDVVDQDNKYFEAIGPLQTGFQKLKEANIEVFIVAGNHDFDVLPELIHSGKYENVHLLGANGTWEMKTFSRNGEMLQFVGWSFPTRHFREDPFITYEIHGLDPNITTIGLLHGEVGDPNSFYAPIRLNNFFNRSVHIWILGHIHKPQFLHESQPIVFYSGSPHALSAKEQGIHGAKLLTIHSQTDIKIDEIPLSPLRYENIFIDVTDSIDEASIRDKITSKLVENARSKIMELDKVSFLIYDITLEGQHSKIRDLEMWVQPIIGDYDQEIDATETRISVRKIMLNVQPKVENMEKLALESSPAGVLAKTILTLERGGTNDFTEKLMQEWKAVHDNIQRAGVYQPLMMSEKIEEDKDPRQYLLNECNRILTELIAQQNQ